MFNTKNILSELMGLKVNKNKIYLLVFLFVILVAIIISIFFFKSKAVKQNKSKNNFVLEEGIIYLEEESMPFTGRMLDTLDNEMIVEFDVVNGLKNGEFFLYSISGKLTAYGFMENNKNSGTWEYYYENGQIECVGEFKDDKPIGKWFWYFDNGVKKYEGFYQKGLPEGKWMKYDIYGNPGSVISFYAGEVISIIEIHKPTMI